ncbi:hypothetical protein ADIARSV_3455 [Arcticibacter svalbardensis MN12-7]|uniref:Dinitrogenase iron-molybdenum cofactor biosynthesis domain-containing protein n=1 Tax=Arcticibacter svalbardensis MN12-7 TaxID=1150600 RepID=R9GNT6_9SPHI|nr:NifB/NifX family molybdenum-iron cluster-binding protein [Arcticibacter svalbardensis]EOR93376.1 hypothetical protein ADIARSV_3455 [Arcticibacter svalbardensis MN12-7]
MIIGIAIQENVLYSRIHRQFGRCPWFAIYDSSSDELTYVKNAEQDSVKDAGLNVASMLIAEGVTKVVAGRFGILTADYLREQRVQMIIPLKDEMTLEGLLENINPARVSKQKL